MDNTSFNLKNFYKPILILALVLAGGLAFYFIKAKQVNKTARIGEPAKIIVSASFYPLAEFAKNVGGNYIEVVNITPPGAEPHDFEPTPKDIAKIYNSRIFLTNGNGVDAWTDKLEADLKNKGVLVIKMSDNLDSLQSTSVDEGFLLDPHFWLNPANVQKEAELIAQALKAVDPLHQTEYNQNSAEFAAKLSSLDEQFAKGLSACEQREIVTSHNAFNYMAHRYNFSTLYVQGISPDQEPSAKAMADLSLAAKQKNIKYVFFESLVSPRLSEALAKEIGAQTLELNPIEGLTESEVLEGKNYFTVMQSNLQNLRTAMQCR